MADDKLESCVVPFSKIRPQGLYTGIGSDHEAKLEKARALTLTTGSVRRFSRLENEIDTLLMQGYMEEDRNSDHSKIIRSYLRQAMNDLSELYREMKKPFAETGDHFPEDLKGKYEHIMAQCEEFMPKHSERPPNQEVNVTALHAGMAHD